MSTTTTSTDSPKAFAALRVPGFRIYFVTSALAMMADSIEHAISYWILFEKFQSPALGGFAALSHWLPFLFFSVYSGALADRFDPRRLIQIGMGLFMLVSICWGLLFLTDTLEMWHAMVLLTLHGFAGVLWGPSAQLLIHDIVGGQQLHSAVRMSSTARTMGFVAGPAVGGLLLLAMGPAWGILFNALIYVPMIYWLWRAPYGPKFREGEQPPPRAVRGLADIVATIREIADKPAVVSMTLLAGGASMFIAGGYHAQMPEFAHGLGHTEADLSYSMLLAADGAGALVAGIALELRGWLKAQPRTACILALLWCVAMGAFAATSWYPLALVLLFLAGFMELTFFAMAQTLVQLGAPPHMRGRVIGLFSMASGGMRAFSGVSIGIVGGFIGIHWSLALAAIGLFTVVCLLMAFALKPANA
ncbi:MAG: MFS transporter [Burkholderiales bacterium]